MNLFLYLRLEGVFIFNILYDKFCNRHIRLSGYYDISVDIIYFRIVNWIIEYLSKLNCNKSDRIFFWETSEPRVF